MIVLAMFGALGGFVYSFVLLIIVVMLQGVFALERLPSKWLSVDADIYGAVGIRSDSTLWEWRWKLEGEGYSIENITPIPIEIGKKKWSKVVSGSPKNHYSYMALATDSTLWQWKLNKIPDTSYSNLEPSEAYKEGDGKWISMSVGSNRSFYAIASDSSLFAWGYNVDGELGNGDKTNYDSRAQIGTNKWISLSTYEGSVLAIAADSTLWGWGKNSSGQLGVGDSIERLIPTQLSVKKWKNVSLGGGNSFALASDSTLWVWGLGYKDFPEQLGIEKWSSLSSTNGKVGLIKHDSTLWTFGSLVNDGLGIAQPKKVSEEKWSLVSVANYVNFSIKHDSTLWIWNDKGFNGQPKKFSLPPVENFPKIQLSKNFQDTSIQPAKDPEYGMLFYTILNAEGLLASGGNSLKLKSIENSVGNFKVEYLVKDEFGLEKIFTLMVQVGENLEVSNWISLSESQSCTHCDIWAIAGDSSLWKMNLSNIYETGVVSKIKESDKKWSQVSYYSKHVAAIQTNGSLWTQGENENGQLGDGTKINKSSFKKIPGNWWGVSTGDNHTLGIQLDSSLWAWGEGGAGQLGIGLNQKTTPQLVSDSKWIEVKAGNKNSFAIKKDSTLWAWGKNTDCELGLGHDNKIKKPEKVGLNKWLKVFPGKKTTLAIDKNRKLWAWGANANGILGDGTSYKRCEPVLISKEKWIDIAVTEVFVIGVQEDNSIWTWGDGVLKPRFTSNERVRKIANFTGGNKSKISFYSISKEGMLKYTIPKIDEANLLIQSELEKYWDDTFEYPWMMIDQFEKINYADQITIEKNAPLKVLVKEFQSDTLNIFDFYKGNYDSLVEYSFVKNPTRMFATIENEKLILNSVVNLIGLDTIKISIRKYNQFDTLTIPFQIGPKPTETQVGAPIWKNEISYVELNKNFGEYKIPLGHISNYLNINPTVKIYTHQNLLMVNNMDGNIILNSILYKEGLDTLDIKLNDGFKGINVHRIIVSVENKLKQLTKLKDVTYDQDFGKILLQDLRKVFVKGDSGSGLTFKVESIHNNVIATKRLTDSVLVISSTKGFFGVDTIKVSATDGINTIHDSFKVVVQNTTMNTPPYVLKTINDKLLLQDFKPTELVNLEEIFSDKESGSKLDYTITNVKVTELHPLYPIGGSIANIFYFDLLLPSIRVSDNYLVVKSLPYRFGNLTLTVSASDGEYSVSTNVAIQVKDVIDTLSSVTSVSGMPEANFFEDFGVVKIYGLDGAYLFSVNDYEEFQMKGSDYRHRVLLVQNSQGSKLVQMD